MVVYIVFGSSILEYWIGLLSPPYISKQKGKRPIKQNTISLGPSENVNLEPTKEKKYWSKNNKI